MIGVNIALSLYQTFRANFVHLRIKKLFKVTIPTKLKKIKQRFKQVKAKKAPISPPSISEDDSSNSSSN